MIVFIPAAGLGTRLRPLTDHCPKALVPYHGKPLLEHLLERLSALGYRDYVINLHHFPQMLAEFSMDYARKTGLKISLSDESTFLLDTGGALTHALPFFKGHDRVLVHNVDIMSDLDPLQLCRRMDSEGVEAVLSVRKRDSSRMLFADGRDRLCAWKNRKTGEYKGISYDPEAKLEEDGSSGMRPFAFSGIHLIRTSLIEKWASSKGNSNRFSVIDAYLEEAPSGKILLDEQQGGLWKDMGKITDFHD